jgi:hypothetical protein
MVMDGAERGFLVLALACSVVMGVLLAFSIEGGGIVAMGY